MQRVLVVPWSRAAAYLATEAPPLSCVRSAERSAREEKVEGEGAEDAADDRSDDRDPGITPVRAALARDRQQRMRDPRPEISRRVDRIARRATQREPDRQHQEPDEQPTQRERRHRRELVGE